MGNALKLVVDRDKMWADLVCVEDTTENTFITVGAIQDALKKEGVVYNVDSDMIREVVENLDHMQFEEKEQIAEGLEPKQGENGRIEFLVDVSGKAIYDASSGDGKNIDFKKATKIICVEPGSIIAEIIPPVPGKPGRTILGENIPAPKPKEAVLRAGLNVETDSKGVKFRATSTGKPVYSEGVLSVLPVYEVPGDVDYNTGHIEFAGSVIVSGNVLDDFNIRAKDITIGGTVGACLIISDNDINISGGVAGKDKAKLIAGGAVKAKYINNCKIECLKDILVQREIVHSTIMTNGKVYVGSLIGGVTMAKLGVEANSLGSDLGIATRVEPGTDLEIKKIENAMDIVDEKIETTIKPVELFFGERQKYKALPEEKKEDICRAHETFKMLYDAHSKLDKRKKKLTRESSISPIKEVIVRKNLCPDTIIATELCMRNFTKPATGPIKIVEDIDHSTMAIKNVNEKENPNVIL